MPVGFKWFPAGLVDGSICFGGEESFGASSPRTNGTVWTTDQDGLILNLLAGEITARTRKDRGEHYRDLAAEFGAPHHMRIGAAATPEQLPTLNSGRPKTPTASVFHRGSVLQACTREPGPGLPQATPLICPVQIRRRRWRPASSVHASVRLPRLTE